MDFRTELWFVLTLGMAQFERYWLYHLLIYSKVSSTYDFQGESPQEEQGNVGDNSQASIQRETLVLVQFPFMKAKPVRIQL